MRIYKIANEKYQSYRGVGPAYVSKRLLQITSLLMPLRRTCSGGSLSQRDMMVSPLRGSVLSAAHIACQGQCRECVLPHKLCPAPCRLPRAQGETDLLISCSSAVIIARCRGLHTRNVSLLHKRSPFTGTAPRCPYHVCRKRSIVQTLQQLSSSSLQV